MSEPWSNAGGGRIAIFKELFASVSEIEATILVGILFEHRFVLTAMVFNTKTGVPSMHRVEVQPLEPAEASARVAEAYALSQRVLYQRFVNQWSELRESLPAQLIRGRILGHESIEDLPHCSAAE